MIMIMMKFKSCLRLVFQLRSSFGKAFSRKKRDTSVSRSNSIGSAKVDTSMAHTWSMPTISDPTWVGQRYNFIITIIALHIDSVSNL